MTLRFFQLGSAVTLFVLFACVVPAAAQFQRQYGTALDESFGKVIPHGTSYYVLGQAVPAAGQTARATVSRIDAAGQLQWTRSLNIASQWNDAILTPSGNLFVVGHTLPFDASCQSLMGVITPTGTFNWVRSYNVPGRDWFNRIVRNPAPDNANFPYYILGRQWQGGTTSATWDDIVLLTVSEAGNLGWKKKYAGSFGSTDDEFDRDLKVLPNGDLLLAGNVGSGGVLFRGRNTGDIENAVGPEGVSSSFTFANVAPVNNGFLALGNTFPTFQAYLMKFDTDLLPVWQVRLPQLTAVRNVWTSGSSIYVSGSATVAGLNRGVVLKLQDGPSAPSLQWMKYLQVNETSYNGGAAWPAESGLAFADGRVRSSGGFGGLDAFLSVSDLEMNTCMTQTATTTLTTTNHTFHSPVGLNIDFVVVPTGTNVANSLVNWQQANACPPCVADFSFTVNCGVVTFANQSNVPAPASWQWTFPGASPAVSTAQNPVVTYAACGSFTVCLTASGGGGCSNQVCKTVVVQDNTPPVALCRSGVSLTLDANCSAAITAAMIDNGSIDNCAISSRSVSPTSINQCGSIPVTLTVTDWCGNTSTCVTTVAGIDNTPPVVVCPANVVVSASPLDTCTAQVSNLQLLTASDNCPNPFIAYQVSGATTASGQGNASGVTFNTGVSTVTYIAGDPCGNIATCSFDVTVLCEEPCPGNIVENSNFSAGATAGPIPLQGSLANWQVAYGTPVVSTDFGCGDPVYVELQGNRTHGSAIYQQLSTPIEVGKVYELSVCVRVAGNSPVPYVKIRALAFNNTLPTTGQHPAPDSDVAIIGVSGRIAICDDWTVFGFHRWRAGRSYNNIAIIIENSEAGNPGPISFAHIDNICFSEVNDSIPCYLAELDSLGNLIPPFGQIDPDCPILEEEVDMLMGNVNDIYGYCNPAPDDLDTWYQFCQDTCESIGGELPDELLDFFQNDSINQYLIDSIGVNDSVFMSELGNFLDSLELAYSNANMIDSLTSLGAFAFNCRKLPPQGPPPNDPNSPFNGMDIVFVHGLRTGPLVDKYNGIQGALTTWPSNRPQFYNGYWKKGAYTTWNSHTEKYLNTAVDTSTLQSFNPQPNGPIYSNRYVVVSHAATQPFFFGAHAVMEQIGNAMLHGEGVINCDPADQRPDSTFGHNGFIIISHSDGAPLTDISLTISELTQYPPLNFLLGDVSFIAERCRVHVAIQGAFGGSNYATLQLMAAAGSPIPGLNKLLDAVFKDVPPALWQFNSELLDMSITKLLWGPLMDRVPVCVLTLSGGHPTDFGEDIGQPHKRWKSYLSKHVIQHGFDDGVLSIESQSANPDSRLFYPNRYLPRPGKLTFINSSLNEKLFDMGIHRNRGIRYYLDQKSDINVSSLINPVAFASCWGPLAASSGTIPWLSPTGMVQPVAIPSIPLLPSCDPLKRYNNHYSFIQSTADHYQGSRGDFPYFPNYERTNDEVNDNCEESRVVTSRDVYDVCGVNASKLQQVEYVRGKSITFTIFKKRYTRWIWKRKYHLLEGYKSKNQLDYLYESLLK